MTSSSNSRASSVQFRETRASSSQFRESRASSSQFRESRAPSVQYRESRASSRAPSVTLREPRATSRCPVSTQTSRWSSALDYLHDQDRVDRSRSVSLAPSYHHLPRQSINYPTYTEALIKSSQRLRDRSLSPTRDNLVVNIESYTPYKSNIDYYRGKVKSIYEKEPLFKDFVRNIPLSELNLYDMSNLNRLKKRFHGMVERKWSGQSSTPLQIWNGERASETLSVKHHALPRAPAPLPFIYVYHRNSRR